MILELRAFESRQLESYAGYGRYVAFEDVGVMWAIAEK